MSTNVRGLHLLASRLLLMMTLSVLCTACRTAYVYHEPPGFDGKKWGEPIQHFEGLEFIAGDEVRLVECRGLMPMQMTIYYKPQETFAFPGTRIESIQYLFCYSGVSAEFCGVDIGYLSEEYDFQYNGVTPTQDTNHRRLISELVKQYGHPHTGSPPKTAITLESVDGSWVDMPLIPPPKYERYSWCAPKDTRSPAGCSVSIISRFNPIMAEGEVLIATGSLRQFVELSQRFDGVPDSLYQMLKDESRFSADELVFPSTCTGSAFRNRQRRERLDEPSAAADEDLMGRRPTSDVPAPSPYPLADDEFFSERVLDEDAIRHNTVREVPTHGLTFGEFASGKDRAQHTRYQKESERAADFLRAKKRKSQVKLDDVDDASRLSWYYWLGFDRGIETQFLLRRFWREDSIERWGKALESKYEFLRQLGLGYRDGLQGFAHTSGPATSDVPTQTHSEQ